MEAVKALQGLCVHSLKIKFTSNRPCFQWKVKSGLSEVEEKPQTYESLNRLYHLSHIHIKLSKYKDVYLNISSNFKYGRQGKDQE